MEIVPTVLSILLALVFLAAGLPKIAGPQAGQRRADIVRLGLSPSLPPQPPRDRSPASSSVTARAARYRHDAALPRAGGRRRSPTSSWSR